MMIHDNEYGNNHDDHDNDDVGGDLLQQCWDQQQCGRLEKVTMLMMTMMMMMTQWSYHTGGEGEYDDNCDHDNMMTLQ